MSKIKFVFFDIDDTLFDFKRSEATALSATLSEIGICPTEEVISLYSKINKGLWETLERGEIEREVLLYKRYEILFDKLSVICDPKRAQSIYEKKLSRTFYYLPDAEEVLKALYGKYRIYLASNGTAVVQDGRISLSGIGKYADGIFISEKIGYNKPNRNFFEYCFQKIEGFDRDLAIIIGDSLSSDIQGGKNAGIKTCLFNPRAIPIEEDTAPDYEIRNLNEIPTLLERI